MNRRRLGAFLIVVGIALGGLGGSAGAQESTTTTEAPTTTTVAPTTTTTVFDYPAANRRDLTAFAGMVVFSFGMLCGLGVLR